MPWILAGALLCLLLSAVCIIYLRKRRKHQLGETELLRLKLQEQNRLLKAFEEQQKKFFSLRHDYKNHILCGVALLNENRIQEAKDYFMQWMDYSLPAIHPFVSTKNEAVNAVVNAKLSLCYEQGIRVSVSVCQEFGSIGDMDLCIILFNLLDNAIDACKQVSDNPEICLDMFQNRSYLVIRLGNSIKESVLQNNPGLHTTKQKKALHGIGLRTVRRVAAKYQDLFRIREENGRFIVEIWLMNQGQDSREI